MKSQHIITKFQRPVSHKAVDTPLAKKIPEFEPDLEIVLLIGSNCLSALEPLEVTWFGKTYINGYPLNGSKAFSIR